MGTRSCVVRFIGILLTLFILSFPLWKIRQWLVSSDELSQQVYLDVDKHGIQTRTNKEYLSGRSFKWSAPFKIPASHANGHGGLTARILHGLKNNSLLFSHGNAVKSSSNIMKSPWVSTLSDLLSKKFQKSPVDVNFTSQQQVSPRKQVTVVVSNTNYTLSLLNWLVAALIKTSSPLENVIVVSLDESLQALLDKKEILSVYINPDTVINGEMHTRASHIWITRCAVYRLLNHWGYDVMAYDTDAIVLKNLQPILDAHPESDIVASSGSYPFPLGRKWGLTICMGVILIKSTRNTGEDKGKVVKSILVVLVSILMTEFLLVVFYLVP